MRRRYLGEVQVLALTATAGPEQAKETAAALDMREPRYFTAPINRARQLGIEVIEGGQRDAVDEIMRPWHSSSPGGADESAGDAEWLALTGAGRTAAAAAAEGAAAAGADEEPDARDDAAAAAAHAARAAELRVDEDEDEDELSGGEEEPEAEASPPRVVDAVATGGADEHLAGRVLFYTRTVEECICLHAYLAATLPSVVVDHYYADRPAAEKKQVLRRWLCGEIHVIVATIAFGMGEHAPSTPHPTRPSAPSVPAAGAPHPARRPTLLRFAAPLYKAAAIALPPPSPQPPHTYAPPLSKESMCPTWWP